MTRFFTRSRDNLGQVISKEWKDLIIETTNADSYTFIFSSGYLGIGYEQVELKVKKG